MRRTLCADLPGSAGTTVRLLGWTHRRRRLGVVSFLILRDRSGLAQVVATGPARAAVAALSEQTPVEVVGRAVANAAAPGGVEVTDPVVRPLSATAEPLPVAVHRPEPAGSLLVRLDHAATALRHPRRAAVARVAAAAVAGMRSILDGQGFTEVFTPKLVATATESGASVFGVDYFGRVAYLAQSPQFAKQTLVGALERVYEVGPVFRAEPHDTVRHLAEYTSLDVELGFVTDHTDVMAVARDVVAGMLAEAAARAAGDLDLLGVRVPAVPATIPAVPFERAQRLIAEGTGEDPTGEPDLAPAHERWLGAWAAREHGSDLLFVTGYPMAKRPFYTHPDPADPLRSRGFDLLWKGMELATGGQRLHRYADYVAALSGVDLTPYQPYLAAFRYGMPPHGGFAFGLERFVAGLVGAANVREVALFPRDAHRLAP